MKRWRYAVLFSFILFFGGCAATQVRHRHPDGFWTNREAVVQVWHAFPQLAYDDKGKPILNEEGKFAIKPQIVLGTGAVVDTNGLVLTNHHIVAKRDIKTADGKPVLPELLVPLPSDLFKVCAVSISGATRKCVVAKVVDTNPADDLALLRVDRQFPRAVKIADDRTLTPGDEVYFWGHFYNLLPPSPIFGRYLGRVGPPYYNSRQIFRRSLPVLFLDSLVVPGCSGSPVFDGRGRVIGWITSHSTPIQGERAVTVVIPSSTAVKFLKQYQARLKK